MTVEHDAYDENQYDDSTGTEGLELEERLALRRVAGLSTEL